MSVKQGVVCEEEEEKEVVVKTPEPAAETVDTASELSVGTVTPPLQQSRVSQPRNRCTSEFFT